MTAKQKATKDEIVDVCGINEEDTESCIRQADSEEILDEVETEEQIKDNSKAESNENEINDFCRIDEEEEIINVCGKDCEKRPLGEQLEESGDDTENSGRRIELEDCEIPRSIDDE